MGEGPRKRTVETRLDDEDVRLFRESVGEVRPLAVTESVRETLKPSPRPRQTEASEASVVHELLTHEIDPDQVETGEELSWLRTGQQKRLLSRLRRGHFSVGAELDLHHMNEAAARTSIHDFLDECHSHRIYCVRIIHGKGLRSKARGPVLKNLVNRLLRRRRDVLAFVSARVEDGGTGAVYVLLQRGR